MLIIEPIIFKIELIGQLVRRLKREKALLIAKNFFRDLTFIKIEDIFDMAFNIAHETDARASDAFYISTAKIYDCFLISNDKVQVTAAKKFQIESYYLLKDFDLIIQRI